MLILGVSAPLDDAHRRGSRAELQLSHCGYQCAKCLPGGAPDAQVRGNVRNCVRKPRKSVICRKIADCQGRARLRILGIRPLAAAVACSCFDSCSSSSASCTKGLLHPAQQKHCTCHVRPRARIESAAATTSPQPAHLPSPPSSLRSSNSSIFSSTPVSGSINAASRFFPSC